MFSEKELNLEETELREQIRNLPAGQRERYEDLERRRRKDPAFYLRLNWLFPVGVHHFYLQRWVRGAVNLSLTAIALYLIIGPAPPLYGILVLVAVVLVEIPQLLNARHLVRAFNNRVMHHCLRRVNRSSMT